MKKIILLAAISAAAHAYDVGVLANTKGAGVYLYESIDDYRVGYSVSVSQEFDRDFSRDINYKNTRGMCDTVIAKNVLVEPVKENIDTTPGTYNQDVTRLSLTLDYTLGYDLSAIAYAGIGYSFSEDIYKDDVYIPIGLRYNIVEIAEKINISVFGESYISQGLYHDELLGMRVGYTF